MDKTDKQQKKKLNNVAIASALNFRQRDVAPVFLVQFCTA